MGMEPSPSAVAQSVINEIWNIVRWLPGSPKDTFLQPTVAKSVIYEI